MNSLYIWVSLLSIGLLISVAAIIRSYKSKSKKAIARRKYKEQNEYLNYMGVTVSQEFILYPSKPYEIRFIVDDHAKVLHFVGFSKKIISIPYSEVIGCVIIEDDEVKGQIHSIASSIIVDGTGADPARNKFHSLKVIIYRNNIKKPRLELNLLANNERIQSNYYKNAADFANDIYSIVRIVLNSKAGIIYRQSVNSLLAVYGKSESR